MEQPYAPENRKLLASACQSNIIPIALDESLVNDQEKTSDRLYNKQEKILLLKEIRPQVLIIKPTNIGGIKESLEWIEIAKKTGIKKIVFTACMESPYGHLQCLDFLSFLIGQGSQDLIDSTHGFSTWDACKLQSTNDPDPIKFTISNGAIRLMQSS